MLVSSSDGPAVKKIKKATSDPIPGIIEERNVRTSTKVKSLETEKALKQSQKAYSEALKLKQNYPQIIHQFTQMELLKDALITEENNELWLRRQSLNYEDPNAVSERVSKSLNTKCKRTLSKRGSLNTVTFTDTDDFPKIFINNGITNSKNQLPDKLCVITNLVAKYRDPVTLFPYANLEAYKILKKRYGIQSVSS